MTFFHKRSSKILCLLAISADINKAQLIMKYLDVATI